MRFQAMMTAGPSVAERALQDSGDSAVQVSGAIAPVTEIFGPPAAMLIAPDGEKREFWRNLLAARGVRCVEAADIDGARAAVAANRAVGAIILAGAASTAVRDGVAALRAEAGRPLAAVLLVSELSFNTLREIANSGPADILSERPGEEEFVASVQSALNWYERTLNMGGASNNVLRMLAQIEAQLGSLVAPAAPRAPQPALPAAPAEMRAPEASIDRQTIKAIMRFRAAQEKMLGAGLIDDAAWMMLLDLLLMHIERKPLAVTALCVGSGVPVTTALRRLNQLIAKGLVTKTSDLADRRRILVSITPKGIEGVCSVLGFLQKEIASAAEA